MAVLTVTACLAGTTHGGPPWPQVAKLSPSDGADDDEFGYSVSIGGDYAIVGARGDDNLSGSAYVYQRNGLVWDQVAKLIPSDGAREDSFACSVSIYGDYAVVGAFGDDDDGSQSGSAYVFQRTGAIWQQVAKLTASDGAIYDHFGRSVAMSGDTIVVGAWSDDDNGDDSGSAYVFQGAGSTWNQVGKLTASDGAPDDRFGISVSISGDYTIVGAIYSDGEDSNSGSVYVFQRSGSVWNQVAKLTASDGAPGDLFGYSVSISGDYAVVGAHGDDDNGINSGSAYMFERPVGGWTDSNETAKVTPSDGALSDWFGRSVSISGDTIVVGVMFDDTNGVGSGSAYVYQRSGSGWQEGAKLMASDGSASNYFGYSVSIGGDYIFAGAVNAQGNAIDSGSAYVFEVPEPGSALLLLVGSGSMILRRRRKA